MTYQSGAEQYQPEDENPASGHTAKNRARWCKGKKGVPHQPEVVVADKDAYLFPGPCSRNGGGYGGGTCKHQQVCAKCGKVLTGWWSAKIFDLCPEITKAEGSD